MPIFGGCGRAVGPRALVEGTIAKGSMLSRWAGAPHRAGIGGAQGFMLARPGEVVIEPGPLDIVCPLARRSRVNAPGSVRRRPTPAREAFRCQEAILLARSRSWPCGCCDFVCASGPSIVSGRCLACVGPFIRPCVSSGCSRSLLRRSKSCLVPRFHRKKRASGCPAIEAKLLVFSRGRSSAKSNVLPCPSRPRTSVSRASSLFLLGL